GAGSTAPACLGTAHRQGAATVTQLEIMPTPPDRRLETNPWPTYPMIMRVSSAHEEGGERLYSGNTERFLGASAAGSGGGGGAAVLGKHRAILGGQRRRHGGPRAGAAAARGRDGRRSLHQDRGHGAGTARR